MIASTEVPNTSTPYSLSTILCFDFQADALRSLCGDKVELQTIDFAEFERRFFSNP